MKIIKSQLKRIIKEELGNVLKEQSRAAEISGKHDFFGKGTNTLEQFIKDNPKAAAYVKSGVKTEQITGGGINPEAIKKSGVQTSGRLAIYYRSAKEKQVAQAISKMAEQRPWSAMTGKSAWRMIGQFFNSSIISAEIKNYGREGPRGPEHHVSVVGHVLSTEYLMPKTLYNIYVKEYGGRKKLVRPGERLEEGRGVGLSGPKLYQYTADALENITGIAIPGSTSNPVESAEQLSDEPIYMYGYLYTNVQEEYEKG
jgi:hypothetical protein